MKAKPVAAAVSACCAFLVTACGHASSDASSSGAAATEAGATSVDFSAGDSAATGQVQAPDLGAGVDADVAHMCQIFSTFRAQLRRLDPNIPLPTSQQLADMTRVSYMDERSSTGTPASRAHLEASLRAAVEKGC